MKKVAGAHVNFACSIRIEQRLQSAGGALWRKKALAQLQSSDSDHADSTEVLSWAEKYFGPDKWPMWQGTT